ncbi:MAG: hypothetical protein PUH10_02545 [Erysipelotrichaceae bacterium]|uniref:hypothetical protein n=1 Tax=Floccifex sp. TaxID=2815810 RepID=UPI002A748A03|nr:hypothetical protein [Floccifex sp.]MDD7280858.1 hypothetical protein [Erysipelotrichaceae bacterium]MDY2958322.1 hypothetical protein [Floccifex sp.]
MNQCLVRVKVSLYPEQHTIWINENSLVRIFVSDFSKQWFIDKATYDHFLYHIEKKRKLNNQLTWKENFICSGDHLILV